MRVQGRGGWGSESNINAASIAMPSLPLLHSLFLTLTFCSLFLSIRYLHVLDCFSCIRRSFSVSPTFINLVAVILFSFFYKLLLCSSHTRLLPVKNMPFLIFFSIASLLLPRSPATWQANLQPSSINYLHGHLCLSLNCQRLLYHSFIFDIFTTASHLQFSMDFF